MTATARDRRDRLRAMLADLKMPGALEAVDGVLAKVDSGAVTAGEAIELVLGAQIALRNNRRLQAAMRSSRLPAVKTLAQFDFTFQRASSASRSRACTSWDSSTAPRTSSCSARLEWARRIWRSAWRSRPPRRPTRLLRDVGRPDRLAHGRQGRG